MINPEEIEKTINITCDTPDFTSCRLDKFLFDRFPDYSRAYFQTLIQHQLIGVNNSTNKKGSYKVKKSDLITVNFPQVKQFDLSPQNIDFEVIDVQDDFIVINKPAGLVVHPSTQTGEAQVTLVNGLLHKFEELNKFENKQRPGIVHRLDKGTSGLMIVARTQVGQIKFAKLFKNRTIKKKYLAVVKGNTPKKGKIDYPIGRHPYKTHLMSHVGFNSKPATTYYEVIKHHKKATQVSVRIITGRTHQIRVHFAAIGHGLLGDDQYGYQSNLIARPALHAHELTFELNGKQYHYQSQPPQDFNDLLTKLDG